MRLSLQLKQLIPLAMLSVVFLFSCTKANLDERILVDNADAKGDPIPPYFFDWETATYVPSASGSNPLQMPWNSGSTAIDPNIVADYKAADGWVMVWNTFSPTIMLNDPNYTYLFSLYNRYRGLLRIYQWQTSTALATSYIDHGLSTYGSSSPSSMLNFSASDFADPSNNAVEFHQMQNSTLTASGGTWLVFQYDIAYDPNIASSTFPSTGLTVKSNWASVSNIELNGEISADIKGYVGGPTPGSSGFGFGSVLESGALSLLGGVYNASYLTLIGQNKSDSYSSALNNAVGGIIQGFLNAIMPKSTTLPVALTMNGDIKLSGSIVSTGGLVNVKYAMPGQSNSQTANGHIPAYNETMGLFNLANRPTVSVQSSWYSSGPWEDASGSSTYYNNITEDRLSLVSNTLNYQWNPAIFNLSANGAHYENLKTEIVALSEYGNPYLSDDYSWGLVRSVPYPQFPIDGGPNNTNHLHVPTAYGTTELIGKYAAAVSIPNSTNPLIIAYANHNYVKVGLRISFDVVPNNGTSPTSTIVKTFAVNLQH